MLRTLGRKRVMAPLALIVGLAVAGVAFAYFTGGGSGSTQAAAVGSASNYTVSFGAATGTMYPGAGSDAIPFTVTNVGAGAQQLSSVSATVDADGSGDITSQGTAVSGCLASWFTASAGTLSGPDDLAASGQSGDAYSGTVTVTMSDSGSDQDACQGQTPDITVSAS